MLRTLLELNEEKEIASCIIMNFLASGNDFPGSIFYAWELWTKIGQSLYHPAWAPVPMAVLSMRFPCCSPPSETQQMEFSSS